MREQISNIEQSIATGTYIPGPWQRLVHEVDRLPLSQRRELSEEISRVSRALHQRHGFLALPASLALVGEWLVCITGLLLLSLDLLVVDIVAVGLITLTLQPLLKTAAGLALGVRYDYAYLWYIEPRFKMRYGTYLCLSGPKRVLLHLAGSIGTPIALWVGYLQLGEHLPWLGYLSLAGALLAGLMQVGAFAAEMAGVRMIGPFRLSQLTSPAMAAYELNRMKNKAGD